MRLIARPIASSGPAGAVVEATNTQVGLERVNWASARARASSSSTTLSAKLDGGAKAVEPLPHYGFEQLARAVATHRIGIDDADRRPADRPRLQNRSTLAKDGDNSIQVRLRHCEWRAFNSGEPSARFCVCEVDRGGDHNTRSAVELLQQIVVDQRAAVFRRKKVGAPARREPDFQTAATHLARHVRDGQVFGDFTVLQFRHPNLVHALALEETNVVLVNHVSLSKDLAATWPEDGAAENAARRFSDVDGLRPHCTFPPVPANKWLKPEYIT